MAATPALVPQQGAYPPAYRPRNPRATSLYQLVDNHYETVKGLWEDRFERRYGFWRGFYDVAIEKYLDCGLFESGFARVVCPRCRCEFLVGSPVRVADSARRAAPSVQRSSPSCCRIASLPTSRMLNGCSRFPKCSGPVSYFIDSF